MKKATDLVAEAKAKIENLDAARVERELAAGVLLVDLREPAELVEQGRIPGSVHVPRGMLEFRADPTSPYHQDGFDPERRVILHCATGGRSALATAALKEMGYTNVAHLDGGFKGWVAAGRPIETIAAAVR
ncbi:MAG: rhodanese-like domain-containing protein [Gemmatimonas sp.]|jgi:rhodanese-related sulfurtransferase